MKSVNTAQHPPVLGDMIDKLQSWPAVRRIYLFGSRARGDNQERSDIDLAVEAPTATDDQWVEMRLAAEDAYTLLTIDLVRLDDASDEFRQRIFAEGKLLYERPGSATNA
ncbi:MAG: nucleotidyltransferase domain-containing protein [Candidatus Hydrogenedentes bacterium]|nr:nucleotidyltransferase domain-containing protein [Candidatus Hydrogenedentota bacterium]